MLHKSTEIRSLAHEPRLMGDLRRLTLLTPEAPLLALLLGIYLGVGRAPLVGGLAALVALCFGVRATALFLARQALAAGFERDAQALSQVALALHPWSADALAISGAAALLAGDAERAERLLGRSEALIGGRAAVAAARSGALLHLDRVIEAAAAARQALAHDATCAAALLHLAQAEHRTGASPSVVEDRLRAGLRAAPNAETEATIRCALAWHLIGQDRHAEARLATSGVEAALPRCAPHHRQRLRALLCALLVAQGQAERAREHLSVAGL